MNFGRSPRFILDVQIREWARGNSRLQKRGRQQRDKVHLKINYHHLSIEKVAVPLSPIPHVHHNPPDVIGRRACALAY